MTEAPSAARCFAIAAPIPFDAPVTTATFPLSLFDIIDTSFKCLCNEQTVNKVSSSETAIDCQTCAGNVSGFVTGKIRNQPGDLFAVTVSPECGETSHRVSEWTLGRIHIRIDGDRLNTVYGNCTWPKIAGKPTR